MITFFGSATALTVLTELIDLGNVTHQVYRNQSDVPLDRAAFFILKIQILTTNHRLLWTLIKHVRGANQSVKLSES